jgi:hypothetical protein
MAHSFSLVEADVEVAVRHSNKPQAPVEAPDSNRRPKIGIVLADKNLGVAKLGNVVLAL